MTTSTRFASTFAFSLLLALALAFGVSVPPAFAAQSAVFTATAAPSYENPATGAVEDSGGAGSAALGQSMVIGITGTQAFVERDVDGKVFVTMRFSQADSIGEVKVASDTSGSGTYGEEVVAEIVREDAANNQADYRFPSASESATLRVSMYVEPMGRSVLYFVKLSDLKEGNAADFVQSVEPGQGSADGAASSGTSAASSTDAAASSSNETAVPTTDSTDSFSTGVREFDGDGHEVTGAQSASTEAPNYALIIGVAAALLAAGFVITYVAYLRPKRAAQDQAAAAAAQAAASRGDDRGAKKD